MNVWRIHIKNDVIACYTRKDLLAFCKEKHLIGVGWNDIRTREDSKAAIKKEAAQHYSNAAAGFKAVNAMRKMQIDDLIWTRLDGIYYLCRVVGLWKDSKPGQLHCDLDISNYVNVKWLTIGTEDLVPGKVVSSFRPAASAQRISGVEEISAYMWNKYSKINQYALADSKMNIWDALSAESIEELVLLYLQVEKGYYIYSTTMKFTTSKYECVLVDKKGIKAFPQVKSGAVSLDAKDYMELIRLDPTAQVYLFATSEQYMKNDCKNVHYISKKELEQFMADNRDLLSGLTKAWLDICGLKQK